MLTLERFSFGVGDRFAHQAKAQLHAFQLLAKHGVHVAPVWNKSNREHTFIGSEPQSVFDAAQAAVKSQGWTGGWHVDADHIRLETVERFLPCSDFFTIDVADSIGKAASAEAVGAFVKRHPELAGSVSIAGIAQPFQITGDEVARVAGKYLLAVQDAGKIYRHIAAKKGGEDQFIAEVSMDETDAPQTPPELLIILAALADEGVKAQTIAPKFTGRFNKGVDYVGDLAQFEKEFAAFKRRLNDRQTKAFGRAGDEPLHGNPAHCVRRSHNRSGSGISRALRRALVGLRRICCLLRLV